MVYYAQKSGHMAACGAACHKKGSAFMPDRIQIKEEAKQVLRGARVNPYLVSLIVVGVLGLLGGLDSYVGASRTVDQVAELYGQQAAAMLPAFPEFPVLLVAFVAAVNWLARRFSAPAGPSITWACAGARKCPSPACWTGSASWGS